MPRPSVITTEKGKEIVSLYDSGKSIRDIVKLTEVPRTSVRRWVEFHCSRIRACKEASFRKSVNHNAFATANQDALYWAGFLMADGCISERHSKAIILSLQYRDVDHVNKFKQFISAENNVCKINNSGSVQARIAVTSDRMADDLGKFGVIPRKTYTAKASDMASKSRHFWRGMVDGDGCIMILDRKHREKQELKICLNGTFEICSQFAEYTRAIYQHNANVLAGNGVAWQIALHAHAAQTVIRHLYTNCRTYLKRKMILAQLAMRHECAAAKGKQQA